MNKLILIDGNAILHRAYHAYPPTLATKDGELTNAIYGFTSTLLHVCRKFLPSHLIVAFDRKEKTFRHQQFLGYKASRPKMDDELVGQIDRTKEVVDILNLPRFELAGFEADDILGTIAKKAQEEFDEILIVTGDKDSLQLLDKKIKVFFPSRGKTEEKIYDPVSFEAEFKFTPQQLIDFKALAGDQSDEIPGVKGIGPKTATQLIVDFGSVENIYKNLERIKESVRTKLEINKDNAFMSKTLATIVLDAPVDFQSSKALLSDYDKAKAIQLFEYLEFKSLIKRLPKDTWDCMTEEVFSADKKEDKKQKEKAENQMSLF
ncbi:hypothetical protein GYA19_05915 [Candidatus Beckwithbacteria bacterium]|nr:hypothetical protein [Candidatus Beckwithbacteria bacterium]